MKKILTLVVTYNRKALLEQCLAALDAQTYLSDILVFDNASTDGTEMFFRDNKKYIYIKNEKNIGGAGGFSAGIKYAIENGYDYVWLMDDDTIAKPNALEGLLNAATILNDDFSFLSSVVRWIDNKACIMNIQKISKLWYTNLNCFEKGIIPITEASFVSFFVNLKCATKVGLPISQFFIYGDDREYSLRLGKEKQGYLITSSVVMHKMDSNVGTSISNCSKERIERCFFDFRNGEYIYRKHHSRKERIKYNLYYFVRILHILKNAKDNRIKRIWVLTKGSIAGMFFNPTIEYAYCQKSDLKG